MKRTAVWAGIAVVLAAALIVTIRWRGPLQADDFDYAAAFERPTGVERTPTAPNLMALSGRSAADVEALLGPPSECEDTLYSRRCQYAQSPVEIVFIDGRADWFTLRGSGEGLPLAAETLAHFGLPVTEPDHATEQENLWRDLAGFKEVRMVGDEYGVSYVRIKALTP